VDSEPVSHPSLRALIESAGKLRMSSEVMIAASATDAGLARFLRQAKTTVVLTPGSASELNRAVDDLKQAGYGGEASPTLAVAIEVTEQSLSEIPAMWRRCRAEGIEPRVQIITPRQGEKSARVVHPNRARVLFEELGRIDREEFNRVWELPPALTGRSCKRHQYACHVTPCGTIFACVGVTIPLGNIRREPLREILELSEVLENLRAFDQKVKEPCGTCSRSTDCYGCRGSAYQLTGDYLTGDGMCWKAAGMPIESLPASAVGLVPHGPMMRMVDQIVRIGERDARITFTVTKECVLVDDSGRLDELAYVEMIAQSFAASHGYHLSIGDRQRHRGLLLGTKDLVVIGEARVGDVLTVHLRKVTRFGAFGVVEGEIFREDGQLVATGQIKIWRPSDSELEAMAL
jgi:radical SAM protein with 4Fe4S-binding SPASM domain